MNFKFLFSALAAIVVGIPLASLGRAQDAIDLSKINCEDYVFYKLSNPNAIAHWLSGYYHGKINDPVIHLETLEENAEKVRMFCRETKNYKTPLMQVIELQIGSQK
jgi:acid stress chaperone HdeB